MPPALPDPPPTAGPSRRQLLRGGLLGLAAVTLSGCSDGRPRTPWSPDPDVEDPLPENLPPDGELILLARERLHGYRGLLGQIAPGSRGRRSILAHLTAAWTTQQERLEQVLTLAGVELPAMAELPTDDAATTSAAPGLDPAVLGEQVRSDLPTALSELSRSTVTNRAMLTSLLAQHAESAHLLGAPVEWAPLVGPVGTAAVPVLQATRPAVFGLEVVAARSVGEERDLFESVLDPLRRVTRALTTLAGDAAPVPPLGYDLPEPLDDAEARMELARALVHDVSPAALSVVDRAGPDEAQLGSLVRIIAEASAWGRELGVTGTAFPGMSLP